jgi:8-oxo-dGTP diphosphatase
MRKRRTARVLLLDEAGRVLLIRLVVLRPCGDFTFWLTPGGEIEPGETEAEAARRELNEELGLLLPVEGPVYTEPTRFEHQGEMRDNLDSFFLGHCDSEAPKLRGVTSEEIALMQEIRWWTVAEIEASGERIFPVDLAAKVRGLG